MGRINTEATKRNTLYKRERNLDKSINNLNIIRMVLEDLEKQGIRCTPIEKLYEREMKRNKRLAKLVESNIKDENKRSSSIGKRGYTDGQNIQCVWNS